MFFNEIIGSQLISIDLNNGEMVSQKNNKQYYMKFIYDCHPLHDINGIYSFLQNPFITQISAEHMDDGVEKMMIDFCGQYEQYIFNYKRDFWDLKTCWKTITVIIFCRDLQIKEQII